MKVNSVSNFGYSPISPKESGMSAKAAPHQEKGATVGAAPQNHNGLTSAERAFFAKLFPDASSQINSHKTYSAKGVHSVVEPGQLVNRKV